MVVKGNGNRSWDYQHIVAGLSGGVCSSLLTHPFDLLKIQFSVHEGKGIQYRPQYSGYLNAVGSILRTHGIKGLYQGAVPNLVGNGMAWGLYFHFFNLAKKTMRKDENDALPASQHLIAGVLSGVATLSLTNPIWVAKTRLCLQYEGKNSPDAYRGLLNTLSRIFKAEGIRGLYKGYAPGLIGTSHGALQFMAYEELRKIYCSYSETPISTKLGNLEYLSFAAISKLFAVSTTYPYQVVRARLQDQHTSYSGAIDVIRKTWYREGPLGFYKGMLASLARVIPATAVTFVVYENVSRLV